MKTYRIQARHRESYIDHLQAENDQDALNKFSKLVAKAKLKLKMKPFLGDRVYNF